MYFGSILGIILQVLSLAFASYGLYTSFDSSYYHFKFGKNCSSVIWSIYKLVFWATQFKKTQRKKQLYTYVLKRAQFENAAREAEEAEKAEADDLEEDSTDEVEDFEEADPY